MPWTQIASDLWTVSQPLQFLGLEVGSRMIVVQLPSQDLVLISPIELDERDRNVLDAIGPVRHIIAPNLFHHLSIGSTQALYPEATVWGVEGLASKRPDLTFDSLLTQPGSFENVLDFFQFKGFATLLPTGIKPVQETVFYHRASHTLILTDIAFNFDQTSAFRTRFVTRLLGSYDMLRPSWLEKWGTRNKDAAEASVRQILAWDFDRVIPGHGSIVETGGKTQLKAGYEWFLGKEL